jgi:hypothetical protein
MKQNKMNAGQTFGEKKMKAKVKVKVKAMRISIIRVSIIMVGELPDDTDRTMGHNIDVHSLLKILFI